MVKLTGSSCPAEQRLVQGAPTRARPGFEVAHTSSTYFARDYMSCTDHGVRARGRHHSASRTPWSGACYQCPSPWWQFWISCVRKSLPSGRAARDAGGRNGAGLGSGRRRPRHRAASWHRRHGVGASDVYQRGVVQVGNSCVGRDIGSCMIATTSCCSAGRHAHRPRRLTKFNRPFTRFRFISI